MEVKVKKLFLLLMLMFSVIAFSESMGSNTNFSLPWMEDKAFKDDVHYVANLTTIENNGNKSSIKFEVWSSEKNGLYKFKMNGSSKDLAFFNDLTTIVDEKNKKNYYISTAKKAYVEIDTEADNSPSNNDYSPMGSSKTQNSSSEKDYVTKKVFIKDERVGQFNCKKYKVIGYYKNNPNEKHISYVWISKKYNIPVKYLEKNEDNNSTLIYVLDKFEKSKLSKATFKVPQNFKKFDNFAQLMMYNPNASKENSGGMNSLMEMYKKLQEGN